MIEFSASSGRYGAFLVVAGWKTARQERPKFRLQRRALPAGERRPVGFPKLANALFDFRQRNHVAWYPPEENSLTMKLNVAPRVRNTNAGSSNRNGSMNG